MKGEKSKTQKEGEGPLGCSKALQDEQTTPEYFRYSMVILATCVAGTEVLGRYPALRTMTELWITKTCFMIYEECYHKAKRKVIIAMNMTLIRPRVRSIFVASLFTNTSTCSCLCMRMLSNCSAKPAMSQTSKATSSFHHIKEQK